VKKRFIFPGVIFLLAYAAPAPAAGWSHPRALTFAPLEWKIPAAERYELNNGMVVYLQRDAELPLFNASALIKVGSVYEAAGKLGLAEITGEVMRTGGTNAPARAMSGDEIDEEIEFLAGSVETWIGSESGGASAKVLQKDAGYGLQLLHDVLVYPAFDAAKLELAKNAELERIRRENDYPHGIAAREWMKAVYGKDSPWARTPTIETVSNITREDLVAFHGRYVKPNNTILTVYGDFDIAEMKKEVEEIFGGWEREELRFPKVAPIKLDFAPGVYFVPKELDQSTILMGHYGIRRHDANTFKVIVMNEILGGGFTSRMTKEVRSNRGLAYSANSKLTEGTDYGVFFAYCSTKTETTAAAIRVMKEVIASMVAEPPTAEELAVAKEKITNRFVFRFDDRAEVVNGLAGLEFWGYPRDYYETYCDNIAAVSQDGVREVAKEYLKPDGLKILVVGNAEGFDEPLSVFGEVKEVELAPPE